VSLHLSCLLYVQLINLQRVRDSISRLLRS